MPGFNKTGPFGQGPMTGRRAGGCTNHGAAINTNPSDSEEIENKNIPAEFFGRGFRRGQSRRGLGKQNRFRRSY